MEYTLSWCNYIPSCFSYLRPCVFHIFHYPSQTVAVKLSTDHMKQIPFTQFFDYQINNPHWFDIAANVASFFSSCTCEIGHNCPSMFITVVSLETKLSSLAFSWMYLKFLFMSVALSLIKRCGINSAALQFMIFPVMCS